MIRTDVPKSSETRSADRPSPIRVLLVDDHVILREGVRMLLHSAPDIEVVGEASDGEEAVQKALDLRPDLVVMDISMPVTNGLVATTRIRDGAPDTHVLVLTMHDEDEYIADMLDAGATGYILKDEAPDRLIEAVRTVGLKGALTYPAKASRTIGRLLRSGRRNAVRRPLTPREIEVVRLVAEGHTNRDIARMLVVSLKTVQSHRTHILQKLGLHDRVDLVKYALRHGLCNL